MTMQWSPGTPLEIVAGTPPGGGLDRTARAIAAAIASGHVLNVPVRVVNVPGDGARKAWAYLDERAGDPTVVSISHPNLTTDYLVGAASFDHRAYTPIAILYTEYIAFVARSDSSLKTGADLLERLRADASSVSVALSTARGNPNHIAFARIALHAGADAKACLVRVFDSALHAVDDVVSGKAEIGAVTAASVSDALRAGQVRVLGVSAPQRLAGPLSSAPTWIEQSIDCVIGAWRGISGAAGIGESHVAFWAQSMSAAIATDAWRNELDTHGWTSTFLEGDALHRYLEDERRDMTAALRELGLLKRTAP
jgi:putative tricarboxylic transport membrane protein